MQLRSAGTHRQYEVGERRQAGRVLVYPALELGHPGGGHLGASPPRVYLPGRGARRGHERAHVLQRALYPFQLPAVAVAGIPGQYTGQSAGSQGTGQYRRGPQPTGPQGTGQYRRGTSLRTTGYRSVQADHRVQVSTGAVPSLSGTAPTTGIR